MQPKLHYATVSEAINQLREQGFVLDFNLTENCIVCQEDVLQAEDLEIVDVYRYEGNTDPSDEAIIYAIQSKAGHKGILVNGYGVSADPRVAMIIKKISASKE